MDLISIRENLINLFFTQFIGIITMNNIQYSYLTYIPFIFILPFLYILNTKYIYKKDDLIFCHNGINTSILPIITSVKINNQYDITPIFKKYQSNFFLWAFIELENLHHANTIKFNYMENMIIKEKEIDVYHNRYKTFSQLFD